MSEGTALREIVARALMDHAVAQNPGLEHFAEGILAHMYHGWADAVLAALTEAGALAPAGLTAEQREACGAGADAIRGQVWASEGRQGNPNPDGPQLGANRMLMDHWRVLRRLAADAATGEPS